MLSGRVSSNNPSIAIVGGGPAGLSAARLLNERGFSKVTVFEATPRLGGKSLSVRYRGGMLEMGTCYSTLDHATTNRWMRQLGVRQYKLGRQMMDGRSFRSFLQEGPGPSLWSEGWRYVQLWRRFMKAARVTPLDKAFLEEAAMPLEEWLERNNLVRMRRFMLRGITAIGYHYIDCISTYQALKWVTPSLIRSGLLNQLKMPLRGWQFFWESVAETLDIRLEEPVIGIDRDNNGVAITTPTGVYDFDQVLITIPLDDLAGVMQLSNSETAVEQSIEWGCYVATLLRVSGWFTNYETESYEAALSPGAQMGRLLSARRERKSAPTEAGEHIYLTAQFGEDMERRELADMLRDDIEDKGARVEAVIFQRPWKYFPRYRLDAIREGLVPLMHKMQGERNTWYSGASFSHEAVSAVTAFNQGLVGRMAKELRA